MNADVIQPPQLTTGRLLLLGASSVILCISFIMAIFAPFPLALAIILYGRTKGLLVGMAGLLVSFVFASMMYGDLTLFGFYLCVFLFGVLIAEIVTRGVHPIKGMIATGLGFILVVATLFGITMNTLKTTPRHLSFSNLRGARIRLPSKKKLSNLVGIKTLSRCCNF